MKALLKAIKYIHSFTNHTIPVKDEADSLYNAMAYKNDSMRTLQIFEALEKRVELEMRLEEQKANMFCAAVNSKWKKEYKRPTYEEQLEINKLHVVSPVLNNRIVGEN